jgi:hypothetical protein
MDLIRTKLSNIIIIFLERFHIINNQFEIEIVVMQLTNAASAIARWWQQDYFVYYGREGQTVPRVVNCVKIHSSVMAIMDRAFLPCSEQLRIVILNDGLQEIGENAFYSCKTLQHIIIPNTVRTIKRQAF